MTRTRPARLSLRLDGLRRPGQPGMAGGPDLVAAAASMEPAVEGRAVHENAASPDQSRGSHGRRPVLAQPMSDVGGGQQDGNWQQQSPEDSHRAYECYTERAACQGS